MLTFKQFLVEETATASNVDGSFTVGDVKFDNERGMGATPNNGNVAYMGCVAWMTPSKFRSLAHESDRNEDAKNLEALMREGKPIGCPFLSVRETFVKDKRTEVKITGHEGRARAQAFRAINGNVLMPVHLFFRGEVRARHLEDELFNWMNESGVIPEGGSNPTDWGVKKVFVAGRTLTF